MVEFDHVTGGYGDPPLFEELSTAIQAKSCVGILGPNGIGKSTLFRLITRELAPMKGEVHRAPRVKLATIDQDRSGLKDDDTLFHAAGNGASHVEVGKQTIHVAGFLRRFLFRREQLEQRVQSLSGGERMRLLLAKMMLAGANVILLDEPTNDLDLMTLRVLEEALLAFDGATLVISHDRALIDRVCSAVLNFEEGGKVVRYASRMQAIEAQSQEQKNVKMEAAPLPKSSEEKRSKQGLNSKEKKELEALPEQLERLEGERNTLSDLLANPETYQNDDLNVAELTRSFENLETRIAEHYVRWESLEGKQL